MLKVKKKSKQNKQTKAPKATTTARKDAIALRFPTHLTENKVIEELRHTVQKLKVFDSLGKTLTSSLDLSEILRLIVEKLGTLVSSRHFGLILLDEASNECYFEFPQTELGKTSFPLGRGVLGRCIERGKGGLITSPCHDPVYDPS